MSGIFNIRVYEIIITDFFHSFAFYSKDIFSQFTYFLQCGGDGGGGGMKNGFFKLPTKEIIGFVITLRHSHFSKTTSIFNLTNSYFFPFSCLSF